MIPLRSMASSRLAARLEGTEPPGFWRTHARLEAEYAKRLPAS